MLRLESETGWWLVTHVDHAHLAGAFANQWGNDRFLAPEPRDRVLRGINAHDDGWAARDRQPQITRQGKPSAFSVELVGKYSAFEEIRPCRLSRRCVNGPSAWWRKHGAYAALPGFHADGYNLLTTARADRSTRKRRSFRCSRHFSSGSQRSRSDLQARLTEHEQLTPEEISPARIENHFRLLQACDNLSLLSSCTDYAKPEQRFLLAPSCQLCDGGESPVSVESAG